MAHVPRLYVPGVRGPGPVTLDAEQSKRLGAVMRLREGDTFIVFGGDGREWLATASSVARGRVAAEVGALQRQESLPAIALETAIAIVRPNRMDWAVEKCTEAGADVIRPLVTAHTVRSRGDNRRERWQRLAVEAVEQCDRLYVPEVTEPIVIEDLLRRAAGPLVFGAIGGMSWEDAARFLPTSGRLTAVVGPEGDFSADEAAAMRAKGAIGVSLGPHVLRTETAALVLTALVRSIRE